MLQQALRSWYWSLLPTPAEITLQTCQTCLPSLGKRHCDAWHATRSKPVDIRNYGAEKPQQQGLITGPRGVFYNTMAPVETRLLDLHVVHVQTGDYYSFMLGLKEQLDRQPFAEAAEGHECSDTNTCNWSSKTRLNDLLGDEL